MDPAPSIKNNCYKTPLLPLGELEVNPPAQDPPPPIKNESPKDEGLATQQSLVRMFLAKSQYYNSSMSSWTLKQWLFHCFLSLKGHPEFPLSEEMMVLRLQEILCKQVKPRHHIKEVFGSESLQTSIHNELNILIALSRQHHFFDWKIHTICSSPNPLLVEEKKPTFLPIEIISKGVALFESSLFIHLKKFQEIVKNCEQSYELLDNHLSAKISKRKERLQLKVTRDSHFVKLKHITSALERFYRLRICPLLSLIHRLQPSVAIPLERKTAILSEIIRQIQIFLPFQRQIKTELEKELNKLITLLSLHKEQQDEVEPAIKKKTLSPEPLPSLPTFKPLITALDSLSALNIPHDADPLILQGIALKANEMAALAEAVSSLSNSFENLTNSVKSHVERQHKKNDLHQKQVGSLVGGQGRYIQLAQDQYVRFEELKNSLNGIDSSILEFVSQELKGILNELTLHREQKIDDSWLELLDDHQSPEHHHNVQPKLKLIETVQEEISSESDDEGKISEPLVSSSHILSKSEITFQIGTDLLDQLKKTDGSDPLTLLTSSMEWISLLAKKPLAILEANDNYKTKRIQIAQSEACDQAFLSACAFEWLMSHAKQGEVISALVAIRPLVMSWHVMIEQTLFADVVAKGGQIPHSHHLTDLTKSQDPIFQELDYALIWSRYPSSSLKRYSFFEKAPFALQWVLKADSWINKLSSGEKWKVEDHLLFTEMMKAIAHQHEKVQSCFVTLLREEQVSSKEKELMMQMHEWMKTTLQKVPTDYSFPKQESEIALGLLKKIEKAALANPNGEHLIEVAAHLRRLLILSQSKPNGHMAAWQSGQWIHLQWAIEHAFLYLCQSKGLGFVQSHDFDFFQQMLNDYTQIEDKPFALNMQLQKELKQLNVAKGVHYPHLAIWEGSTNQTLIDWVHLLEASREQIRTQGWSTQRKKHSEKSLVNLQKQGIAVVAKLMDYILT